MRKEELERLRVEYPKGTILELTEDMQSDGKPEINMVKGLQGRLSYIDDAGQIHMHWRNGRSLALIPGVDSFKKVGVNNMGIEGTKIETIEEKIDYAKQQPIQTMQTNLVKIFTTISNAVIDNTPDFNYNEDNEGTKAKNNLYNKLIQECRVYENSQSYLYCSNEVIEDKTSTILHYDEPITCPETFMFTLKPNDDWVLESLSCVAEGKKLFTQRHQPKLHPAPAEPIEPYTMVLIMTKCDVEVVYINREE